MRLSYKRRQGPPESRHLRAVKRHSSGSFRGQNRGVTRQARWGEPRSVRKLDLARPPRQNQGGGFVSSVLADKLRPPGSPFAPSGEPERKRAIKGLSDPI
jgi:hypothetical protein